ncbi:MAG: hypothetical protein Q8O43_02950 [Dehalococcoidia bacterium]|nr:hypothetical protein [Dehalococcoidia bacterium]
MAHRRKAPVPAKEDMPVMVRAPEENVFWCSDGKIFRDIKDLAEGLAAMSDETYAYHANTEKNDFSKWVRYILNDEKLARDLEKARDRIQAARYATSRVSIIR